VAWTDFRVLTLSTNSYPYINLTARESGEYRKTTGATFSGSLHTRKGTSVAIVHVSILIAVIILGNMKDYVLSIYADRFDKSVTKRDVMWKILCEHYFQKFIEPNDTVLDLAAGYCEFINNIRCGKKIAVDLNRKTKFMANKDVIVYQTLSTKLPKSLSSKVDVVFVSNFFEHLESKNELIDTLKEIHRVLKPGGRIMILQPNIRLVGNQYWDYVDHTLPITEKSLLEAFHLTQFAMEFQKTRFLPYTANSKTPAIPLFIRAYLMFPPAQLLMGKQTFVIGRKLETTLATER